MCVGDALWSCVFLVIVFALSREQLEDKPPAIHTRSQRASSHSPLGPFVDEPLHPLNISPLSLPSQPSSPCWRSSSREPLSQPCASPA